MPYGAFTTGVIANILGPAVLRVAAADALMVEAKNISQTEATEIRIRVYDVDVSTGVQTKIYDSGVQTLPAFRNFQAAVPLAELTIIGITAAFKYEVVFSTNNAEFTAFSSFGYTTGGISGNILGYIDHQRALNAELTRLP
jgi:hypothetical protein